MKVVKIDKENAQFQILNALKTNREKRNKEGFIFEGVRNINNALKYNWPIKSFFYSSEKGLSNWARDILKNYPAPVHYDLSLNLLKKLSGKAEVSELLALAAMPKDNLGNIKLTKNLLAVIFDRPANPGNLGTIIRTGDAFGINGLIITGHAVDVYEPETISATTGSLFSLPIVRLVAQNELADWLGQLRQKYPDLQIVGTDEKAEQSIYQHDFRKPTILLVGNEKLGLSQAYQELVDSMVKIPMQGSASSLNVAVAASIVISEIKRQRSDTHKHNL